MIGVYECEVQFAQCEEQLSQFSFTGAVAPCGTSCVSCLSLRSPPGSFALVATSVDFFCVCVF